MPLIKGAKPGSKGFRENIREMYEAGHPLKQSVAAAYSASKEAKMTHKKEHHSEHSDHKHMHHHHKEMHKHHAKELKHHEKMMHHHSKHSKKK